MGAGQLVIAFGGALQAGKGIQQAGDIAAGTISGISVLLGTGNARTAQQAANFESLFITGAGS